MSDEKPPIEEEGARGCLGIMILLMVVALVVLVLACVARIRPDLDFFAKFRTAVTTTVVLQQSPQDTEPEQTVSQTVAPTQAPEEEPTGLQSPIKRVVALTALLEEPDTDASELAALTPGMEVSVLGQDGSFNIVDYQGKRGYVALDCLRPKGEYLVVIDAGHQQTPNDEPEPIGPGASEKKPKVTAGAQGVATGIEEYELNLQVAKRLRKVLEKRGYQVKMIRTTHNVDISNSQRAETANELRADAFIRIHANSDDNAGSTGIMTVCQTESNPYNAPLCPYSKKLSECMLDQMTAATGASRQLVWQTDTMSGINWCQVPVTIVEMGYLSNPKEDRLLSTGEYQDKLAQGMADGIQAYFQWIVDRYQ